MSVPGHSGVETAPVLRATTFSAVKRPEIESSSRYGALL